MTEHLYLYFPQNLPSCLQRSHKACGCDLLGSDTSSPSGFFKGLYYEQKKNENSTNFCKKKFKKTKLLLVCADKHEYYNWCTFEQYFSMNYQTSRFGYIVHKNIHRNIDHFLDKAFFCCRTYYIWIYETFDGWKQKWIWAWDDG